MNLLERKVKLNAMNIEASDIVGAIGEAIDPEIDEGEYETSYLELEEKVNSGIEKFPFTDQQALKLYVSFMKKERNYWENNPENPEPVPMTKVVLELWRNRGREEITVKEFLLTLILIKVIDRKQRDTIAYLQNRTNSMQSSERPQCDILRIRKIIEECGDQVPIFEAVCLKWLENHQNGKGCPHELGCEKLTMIIRAFVACFKYDPKSWKEALEAEDWLIKKNKEILNKKTLEELEEVFVPL